MNPDSKRTINGVEHEGWERPLGFLAKLSNGTRMFYDAPPPASMNPNNDVSRLDKEGQKAAKNV